MALVVQYEVRGVEDVDRRIFNIKNGVAKATAGAINDLLKSARTDLAKSVRDQVKVTYGSVLSRIKIRKASEGDLSGSVSLREKSRIGLVSFGAKRIGSAKKPRGIRYQISKTGGKQTITDAFIGKASTGSQLRAYRRRGKSRLPLIDLKGPSLNAVVNKNQIDEAVKKTIGSKLPDRIASRIKLLIAKGK